MSEKLAAILRKHYIGEKPTEKVQPIVRNYDLSSNLSKLVPTKVNHEIWRACSGEIKEADLKMQTIQKSLVASLVPLSLLSYKFLPLSPVTGKSSLSELINLASGSMFLISSAN